MEFGKEDVFNSMIRAIALDIDGTITDNKRVLCSASIQAIRDLKVPVILATGNTHCFTRTIAIALGTPLFFIAENGGIVSYSDHEMEILADIKVCEAALQELGKAFNLHRHESRYRFTDITLKRDFDVEAALRYVQERSIPVELIDTAFAVHIKDKGVSKGTGLECISRRLGISLEEFAAVGDSRSDISMFELAGFGAAVGNADAQLKAASDYVASAEFGEGFAEILDYMAKQGMLWNGDPG